MSSVRAYYDGATFFPIEAVSLPVGKVVSLTIDEEDTPNPEIARKLAQLAYINGNLEKLNETEPLPPEFDEILAQRINFASGVGTLSVFVPDSNIVSFYIR